MIRSLRPAQLAIDVGLAAACVLLRVAIGIDGIALTVVVVAMGVALALRRLSPALALGVAWLGAVVQLASVLPPDIANLAILPVLYATARRGTAAMKWVGLASAVLGALVATGYLTAVSYRSAIVGEVAPPEPSRVVVTATILLSASAASLVLSWTLGLLARTWSAARESRRRETLAEQTVAIEQERNRIARDMHDVVAHSLAVVIAQADGARYARATDPDAVDSSLVAISSTAREALADVRLLLAQLRHDEAPGPQPVLSDLDRLYDQLRASGLPVDLVESGSPAGLPAGVQIAVFRIVQEALTNALRHGSGEGARVELAWLPERVSGVVINRVATTDRADAAVKAPGHGIDGMRERALLAGGTLSAGPRDDGFVVDFTIPTVPTVPTVPDVSGGRA
ncbi:sensor histidine kinase [Herbiconiux sp. A18JL235]|uniref:histidine kinase n=1 Tax=Herbiconiux sp. A18JL235 TaxID=3152363 RepID=A0AB39BJI2_9MICO